MGNHTIDCEFCGQDQRLIAGYCCAEYEAQQRKKDAEYKARVDADSEYLARFGLTTQMNAIGHCTKLDADDVVAFLKGLEQRLKKRGMKGIPSGMRKTSRV